MFLTQLASETMLESSKKTLNAVIKDLNQHLHMNTFLVTERLTLADLAVASSLVLLYRVVIRSKIVK